MPLLEDFQTRLEREERRKTLFGNALSSLDNIFLRSITFSVRPEIFCCALSIIAILSFIWLYGMLFI